MGEFVETALGFPTALFSFLLLLVLGYWLLVVFGVGDGDSLDGISGLAGLVAAFGLDGVPITVAFSVLIAVAWFTSLAGGALLDGLDASTPLLLALGLLLLAIAVVVGWAATWLVVLGLRRLFPRDRETSRADFVGRVCVVRTGKVSHDFGQAEVTAADGSSAIIQVRQNGDEPLSAGDSALIFDYDGDGEFFWITPYDAELDPNRPLG